MPHIRYMCCLLILTAFLPRIALSDPPCAPAGSVLEIPDNFLHGWLSKLGPDQAKAYVETLAQGEGKRWEGDTLIITCKVENEEPVDISAASVEGAGPDIPDGAFTKDYFAGLAARTGHSKQEADVLYKKYARLKGAFYRQVPDGNGSMVNESTAIFNRHKRDIDTSGVEKAAGSQQDKQKQAEALKKKILAAQAKGDMNEMMRLAAEVQQMNAPVMEQTAKMNRSADQQQWQMLEGAYAELAQVTYRSKITIFNGACLPCALNE
jgi:hypothetical protein